MSTATPLEQAIREQLGRYFADLGDATPHDVLAMVNDCVERTVLQVAMERSAGNQTHAADLLGITRGTLRKKLLAHQIRT